MATDLPRWQLNAKKWREENGFTGEEWQMYVRNRNNVDAVIRMLMYFLGVAVVLFGLTMGWL